jgi:hypothetical protein
VRVLLLLTLAFARTDCRAHPADPTASHLLRASPGKLMLRTELYFGIARRGGGTVSDEDWRAFLRDEVTPRFPDGLTILESRGQWRGPDGKVIEEPSRVVMVLYDPADRQANDHIEQIRAAYESRFDQDAVMRADSVEHVSF